jgi:hypothetical protein
MKLHFIFIFSTAFLEHLRCELKWNFNLISNNSTMSKSPLTYVSTLSLNGWTYITYIKSSTKHPHSLLTLIKKQQHNIVLYHAFVFMTKFSAASVINSWDEQLNLLYMMDSSLVRLMERLSKRIAQDLYISNVSWIVRSISRENFALFFLR